MTEELNKALDLIKSRKLEIKNNELNIDSRREESLIFVKSSIEVLKEDLRDVQFKHVYKELFRICKNNYGFEIEESIQLNSFLAKHNIHENFKDSYGFNTFLKGLFIIFIIFGCVHFFIESTILSVVFYVITLAMTIFICQSLCEVKPDNRYGNG